MLNALSVDLEEYFHPTEVQTTGGMNDWLLYPSRLVPETDRILDLLARKSTLATFFVLGWVAERHGALVRRIAEAGHEIACHSYAHRLIYELTPSEFRQDTERAVRVIEDASGFTPRAYRAPSYSITGRSLWALDILAECGFTHDSSIYPITHDRYGIPGFTRHPHTIQTVSGPICEIPIATIHVSKNTVTPVGGGAYLRLLPYVYTAAGIRRLNIEERRPACVYFHPWEIDPDIPKIGRGTIAQLRTYTGLGRMASKIERLVSDFEFSSLARVYSSPLTGNVPIEIGDRAIR